MAETEREPTVREMMAIAKLQKVREAFLNPEKLPKLRTKSELALRLLNDLYGEFSEVAVTCFAQILAIALDEDPVEFTAALKVIHKPRPMYMPSLFPFVLTGNPNGHNYPLMKMCVATGERSSGSLTPTGLRGNYPPNWGSTAIRAATDEEIRDVVMNAKSTWWEIFEMWAKKWSK